MIVIAAGAFGLAWGLGAFFVPQRWQYIYGYIGGIACMLLVISGR